MRVETLMIANGAGIDKGLLHVQGGGWEYYTVTLLPWTLTGAVCGVFVLDDQELGSTHIVRMSASADGKPLDWAASLTVNGDRPKPLPGVPARIPFCVPITTVIQQPCVVKITVSGDNDAELAATAFAVPDPIPDAPPPSG